MKKLIIEEKEEYKLSPFDKKLDLGIYYMVLPDETLEFIQTSWNMGMFNQKEAMYIIDLCCGGHFYTVYVHKPNMFVEIVYGRRNI